MAASGAATGGGAAPAAAGGQEPVGKILALPDDIFREIISFCGSGEIRAVSSASKLVARVTAGYVALKTFPEFCRYAERLEDAMPQPDTEPLHRLRKTLQAVRQSLDTSYLFSTREALIPLETTSDIRKGLLDAARETRSVLSSIKRGTAVSFGLPVLVKEQMLNIPKPEVVQHFLCIAAAYEYINYLEKSLERGMFSDPVRRTQGIFDSNLTKLVDRKEFSLAMKLVWYAPYGDLQSGQTGHYTQIAKAAALEGSFSVAEKAIQSISEVRGKDTAWGAVAEAAAKKGDEALIEQSLQKIFFDDLKALAQKAVDTALARRRA